MPGRIRCRVFPLPGVVLFPGMLMPLRIFEPRYLQLLENCLEDDRRITMSNIRAENIESLQGDPDVFEVAGEGEVIHCERLPDETFRVILEGRRRVRLENECPRDDLVRIFEAQESPDIHEDQVDARLLGILEERIATWIDKRLPASVHESVLERIETADSLGNKVDRMASLVVHVPAHRQALIETADVSRRVKILENLTRWAGSTGPFGLTTMN